MVSTLVSVTPAQPFIHRNYEHPSSSEALARQIKASHYGGSKHSVWQAVRASSAAPYYLEDFTCGGDRCALCPAKNSDRTQNWYSTRRQRWHVPPMTYHVQGSGVQAEVACAQVVRASTYMYIYVQILHGYIFTCMRFGDTTHIFVSIDAKGVKDTLRATERAPPSHREAPGYVLFLSVPGRWLSNMSRQRWTAGSRTAPRRPTTRLCWRSRRRGSFGQTCRLTASCP